MLAYLSVKSTGEGVVEDVGVQVLLGTSYYNAKPRLLSCESAAKWVMVADVCSFLYSKYNYAMYNLHSRHQGTQREPAKVQIAVNRQVGTETQWPDPKTLRMSYTFYRKLFLLSFWRI